MPALGTIRCDSGRQVECFTHETHDGAHFQPLSRKCNAESNLIYCELFVSMVGQGRARVAELIAALQQPDSHEALLDIMERHVRTHTGI